MSEWQPIETCPSDREVLVWKAESESAIVALRKDERWVTAWAHDPIEGPEWFKVTHWMPLPAAPGVVTPGPTTSIGRGAATLRRMFDLTLDLAERYGDNLHHCTGEQADRAFARLAVKALVNKPLPSPPPLTGDVCAEPQR